MSALQGDMLSTSAGYRTDGGRDGRGDIHGESGRGEGKDDVRTQFITREGTYRLLPLSEYGRPNRVQPNGNNNIPVRVSFVKTQNSGASVGGNVCGTVTKGAATPGSVNLAVTSSGQLGSPDCTTAPSGVANGGIYMGWGGATTNLGSPNGPIGEFGGGSGWQSSSTTTGISSDIGGLSSVSWNGGVQGTSPWNGGSTLNKGMGASAWNSSSVNDASSTEDKICFNVGKELYVYHYSGIHKPIDLSRPIDKRLYRGTSPTCHDFNSVTCRPDRAMLVVGFTAGQVQLIDPIGKEISRLFNEERHIDKTRVTCVRWLPESPNQFLVSHVSGQLYVYDENLPCGTTPPTYQLFKAGEGFTVHTCKTKSTRNPLYRWLIDGAPAINEFAFSPCYRFLAVACGDGFLRVYNYDRMELVGTMKSYFGGLLCVAWSPDGRYIATGGEDDLVTVWSFVERRVVCRGRGHTSWVNVVAFDPFTTIAPTVTGHSNCAGSSDDFDLSGSDEDVSRKSVSVVTTVAATNVSVNGFDAEKCDSRETSVSSYRFGSVGQDTVLCLWDLTEDLLRRPTLTRQQRGSFPSPSDSSAANAATPPVHTSVTTSTLPVINNSVPSSHHYGVDGADTNGRPDVSTGSSSATSSASSLSRKYASLSLNDSDASVISLKHRHSHSVSSKSELSTKSVRTTMTTLGVKTISSTMSSSMTAAAKQNAASEAARLLGTVACPSLHDVPLLEPLTCKKIAHERLSALVFRNDCFVTACQEGNVYTWARPAAWPVAPTAATDVVGSVVS